VYRIRTLGNFDLERIVDVVGGLDIGYKASVVRTELLDQRRGGVESPEPEHLFGEMDQKRATFPVLAS
jgi:hypothetical protein